MAQDRDLNVNVTATTDKFERGMRSASAEARKLSQEVKKQEQSRKLAGEAMLGFGTAALAGVAMATKAAIDWESSWTGVAKTVDGTAAQMSQLEGELREMARTGSSTHQEIAAVAEAAGQLGIKREDIAKFTQVMLDLGATTDLTSDAAATAIAQISNVMGTASGDVDRFGAALVELGNNGASTESEILMMAQRIAGAGNQIGLAETDVLGLASALSSVGIEAEAGGSSVSTAMIKMAVAVNDGGDALDTFARVSGVTSSKFKQQFETDAAGAITMFVEGLGRMQTSGEDVFGVLSELGLSEIRVRDAMLRLAGAGDLVRESLDTGARAWEENTALTEEAEKRYATAAARIQTAWNAIKDAAIDVGAAIAPIIGSLADAVGLLGDAFNLLPGPVKSALGLLGGVAGLLAVAGGAFLLFAPRIVKTREALRDLGFSSDSTGGKLRGLARAAGVASVGLVGVQVAGEAINAVFGSDTTANVDELAESLEEWATTGKSSGEAARVLGDDLSRVDDAFWALTGWDTDLREFMQGTLGGLEDMSGSVANAHKTFLELDEALANLVTSGHGDGATVIVGKLSDKAREAGMPIEELMAKLPLYSAAWDDAAAATGGAAFSFSKVAPELKAINPALDEVSAQVTSFNGLLGMDIPKSVDKADAALTGMDVQALASNFGLASASAEEAEEAISEMVGEWAEAFAEFVPMVDAYETALEDKKAAEQSAAEKTADSTKDSSDSWEDYIGDVTLTVDEYMAQLERMAKDQAEWADNMISLAGRVPDAMLDHLARLGPEGAGTVALLTKMSNKELRAWAKNMDQVSGAGAEKFAANLRDAAPVLRAIGKELGEGVANKIRDGMAKRGTTVYEEAKRQGVLIEDGVDINKARIVLITANGKKAVDISKLTKNQINKLLGEIDDEPVKVTLNVDSKGITRDVGGSSITSADGNVFESHQAEIAPGGAWRVWAEPETGGEAYIPLAPSKRGRSMDILGKVAEKFGVGLMPFADGGATVKLGGAKSGVGAARGDLRAAMQAYGQKALNAMVALGMFGGPSHPGLAGALAFVKSEVGDPYVWGGVGPGGYDCSGLISAAVNQALGRPRHSRLGNTASFPWSMFAPGPGAFTVGSFRGNPGHMAGRINGTNIESRGGVGVLAGSSARSPDDPMFTTKAHLKGFADGGILEGDGPWDQLDPRGKHFAKFDGGGLARGTGLLAKDVIHPERVLSPRQTASFERLVQVLDQPRLPVAPEFDYRRFGAEVRKAVSGMPVILDGRKVGEVQGGQADRYARGG